MNLAFKHLEAKLRFADLSIGQWAAVLGGVLFAFVFAEYAEPGARAGRRDPRRLPGSDPGKRGVLREPERVRSVGADRRGDALEAPRGRYVPGGGSDRVRVRAARPMTATPGWLARRISILDALWT